MTRWREARLPGPPGGRRRLLGLAAGILLATACSGGAPSGAPAAHPGAGGERAGPATAPAATGEEEAMTLAIRSGAFPDGGEIPARHTCEGADVSPPLRFEGVPPGTRSLALVVEDPDAPDPRAPRMTWVHWVIFDLPPDLRELPEDLRELPPGAREGRNDWKRTGWGGPCPPIGRHRYFFRLFALDRELGDLGEPTRDELLRAIEGHVLARAELVGTYQKTGR